VEFVEYLVELVSVVGRDGQHGVGLGFLVGPDVELFHLERPAHVHHDTETSLHHPRVDDVSFEFDGLGDGHVRPSSDGAKRVVERARSVLPNTRCWTSSSTIHPDTF
jgi:hypothetical protein